MNCGAAPPSIDILRVLPNGHLQNITCRPPGLAVHGPGHRGASSCLFHPSLPLSFAAVSRDSSFLRSPSSLAFVYTGRLPFARGRGFVRRSCAPKLPRLEVDDFSCLPQRQCFASALIAALRPLTSERECPSSPSFHIPTFICLKAFPLCVLIFLSAFSLTYLWAWVAAPLGLEPWRRLGSIRRLTIPPSADSDLLYPRASHTNRTSQCFATADTSSNSKMFTPSAALPSHLLSSPLGVPGTARSRVNHTAGIRRTC